MKNPIFKISLIFIATIAVTALCGFQSLESVQNKQEVPDGFWYSWEDGLAKAIKEDKMVLVDVYTNWCGYCVKMDKETYAKDTIQKIVNADFVPIKINPEDTTTYLMDGKRYTGVEITKFLAGGRRFNSYPITYFWLDPAKKKEGSRKYLQRGYLNAETMAEVLRRVKKIKGK